MCICSSYCTDKKKTVAKRVWVTLVRNRSDTERRCFAFIQNLLSFNTTSPVASSWVEDDSTCHPSLNWWIELCSLIILYHFHSRTPLTGTFPNDQVWNEFVVAMLILKTAEVRDKNDGNSKEKDSPQFLIDEVDIPHRIFLRERS
jgi:hypothetical protein